uniref:Biotin attachment protein n=1 Tax=Caldimicrobium thiodismutans TaxID=1653476 RepID=A0A832GLS6_9BACT
MKIDFQELTKLLQKFKVNPYKLYPVLTPHTGYIREFKVKEGDQVKGPSGTWLEKPGTPLFVLEREKNPKVIRASLDGVVQNLRTDLLNKFVEAGVEILSIRHPLSQEEIISEILISALYVVRAPETARYILSPDLAKKLEKEGLGKLKVREGEELLLMTFMKRETPIYLKEKGEFIIYQIYFKPFELVQRNSPLLGLCPVEDLPYLERIIQRIKEEWPS